jgi:hypothetical protein
MKRVRSSLLDKNKSVSVKISGHKNVKLLCGRFVSVKMQQAV